MRLLQEHTGDGYVFRTDLRLRPDPGATQVALSIDAALSYYESFGQNWERAALIKARIVAGDAEAGEEFLTHLSPFIWRKYLDYAAIADIHAMKRRVHAHKGHGKIAVAGHDIKLGRGGIRDIEFFAQTQQLIAGGRHPELRTRGTIETLHGLAQGGWVAARTAQELIRSYLFLRMVENRLQMIGDQQTHVLPDEPEELRRVALLSGFASADEFAEALLAELGRVETSLRGTVREAAANCRRRRRASSCRATRAIPRRLPRSRGLGFTILSRPSPRCAPGSLAAIPRRAAPARGSVSPRSCRYCSTPSAGPPNPTWRLRPSTG